MELQYFAPTTERSAAICEKVKSLHELYEEFAELIPGAVSVIDDKKLELSFSPQFGDFLICGNDTEIIYTTEEAAKEAAIAMHNYIKEELKHPERNIYYAKNKEQ